MLHPEIYHCERMAPDVPCTVKGGHANGEQDATHCKLPDGFWQTRSDYGMPAVHGTIRRGRPAQGMDAAATGISPEGLLLLPGHAPLHQPLPALRQAAVHGLTEAGGRHATGRASELVGVAVGESRSSRGVGCVVGVAVGLAPRGGR